MRNVVPTAAALVLGALLAATAVGAGDARVRAADFTLEQLDGGETSLAEALEDGPVILEFWASWCGPCRRALPRLQALQDRYRDRGLTVLAINQDDPRSLPKVGALVRSLGLRLPVLLDTDKRVARLYQVSALPATFLVAGDGTVAASHRGYRDGDEDVLERELLDLLGPAPGNAE